MTMIATGVGPSIKRERKEPEAWSEKEFRKKKQKMFFQKALNTQNQKYTSITVHLQEKLCERGVIYRSPENQKYRYE